MPSLPLRECHQVAYDWARATLPDGRPRREPALRVAVVGCGDIAARPPRRDPAPTAEVELVGVCDVDEGRRAAAAARGGLPGLRRPDRRMLDARRHRTSCTCAPRTTGTPTWRRSAWPATSRCCWRSRVAHTLADGERLARAAEDSSAVLGVCFQNRYNDTARALRELLDGGELGRVLGGRASVTWFRDAAYYARARLARPLGHRRRRGADEPGDPHPGPAAVVLGPVTDVRGTGRDAGAARRHRGGGHRRAAAAAPHPGRRPRHARSSTPPTATSRTPRSPSRSSPSTPGSGWTPTSPSPTTTGGSRSSGRPPSAVGERAYWGVSHGLLIDDFYRHVRAGKRFWIDAPAALETLRVIQAVYDQSPGLSR